MGEHGQGWRLYLDGLNEIPVIAATVEGSVD